MRLLEVPRDVPPIEKPKAPALHVFADIVRATHRVCRRMPCFIPDPERDDYCIYRRWEEDCWEQIKRSIVEAVANQHAESKEK